VLVELGVVEQRYDATKEVLERRGTVTEIVQRYGVTRQSGSGATRRRGWPAWWTARRDRRAVPTARQCHGRRAVRVLDQLDRDD
jgi:hypothetical protein